MNRPALALILMALAADVAGAAAQEASSTIVVSGVGVRVGEHPSYSRVTFDLPRSIGYRAARVGDVVTLTFDAAGTIAVGPPEGAAYGRVTGVTQTSAPRDPLVVAVGVSSGANIRHFVIGTTVVLDVVDDSVAAPAQDPQFEVGTGTEYPTEAETQTAAALIVPPIPRPRPAVVPPPRVADMDDPAGADPAGAAASEAMEDPDATTSAAEAPAVEPPMEDGSLAEPPVADEVAGAAETEIAEAGTAETGTADTAEAPGAETPPAIQPVVSRPAALDSVPETGERTQFDIAAAQAEALGSVRVTSGAALPPGPVVGGDLPEGASPSGTGLSGAALSGAGGSELDAVIAAVTPEALAPPSVADIATDIAFVGSLDPMAQLTIDPDEERYRSGRATFDLLLPTGLAAFERAGSLYLVFAARGPIDAAVLLRQGRDGFPALQEVPAEGGVVLRLALDEGTHPTVGRFTTAWTVSLAQRAPRAAATALEPQIEWDAEGTPEIVMPRDGTARVVRFTDPLIGDRIVAVPVAQLGAAVNERRSYVQFDLLATSQGIVIEPKTDSLSVRIGDEGVRIDDTGGLLVSLP